jgi:hypothetical protein
MFQSLSEDAPHMVIVQGIKNNLAIPAVLYQFALPQGLKLMGNGGFGHIQQHRYITDTKFLMQEGADYADPRSIPKDLKKLRQVKQGPIRGNFLPYPVHRLFMDNRTIAPVIF